MGQSGEGQRSKNDATIAACGGGFDRDSINIDGQMSEEAARYSGAVISNVGVVRVEFEKVATPPGRDVIDAGS